MAQYGDQHGHVQNHNELDSQTAHDTKTGGDMAGRGIVTHEHTDLPQQEKLHRTTNTSSSSSEDEGEGGLRKKKGLTEKIMDKIPGVGHKEQQPHDTAASAATTMPGGEGGHGEEKKGMVDKIKEKLPGVN